MDSSSPGSSVHGIFQARKEYWRGLPFPTPEDLPDPGIKLTSLASPALADGFFTLAPSFPSQNRCTCCVKKILFFFSYSQISFSVTNNININKRLLNVFLIWLHQTHKYVTNKCFEMLKDVFSSSPIPVSELPQCFQIEEMAGGIDHDVAIIMASIIM